MTYKQIIRYATVITRDEDRARDVVHDFYINLHKQGIDLLDGKLPKNFIYKGLRRTSINYLRKFHYYVKNKEKIFLDCADVYELEIPGNSLSPVQLCVSQDIIDACIKNISIGHWDTYHFREATNTRHREQFLQIFNYYALGYTTSDIAKIFEMPPQNLNYYKYLIKKWIQPILK